MSGVLRRAAAHDGLDAREQLARRERLDEVVVRARLEPGDLVGLGVAAGEQDDGHRERACLGAQLAGEGKAGRVGSIQSRRISWGSVVFTSASAWRMVLARSTR
jgi:hypothetical protein